MNGKPVSRAVLTVLVSVALVLAVSLVVILAVACLIGKMGDSAGQAVLEGVGLAVGLLWSVDLICLVLAVGINSLHDSDSDRGPEED